MKNTKGLSTIVTTLILVLLVLVAVGILWNPVKNLLNENTEAFDKTKCLTVDLKPKVTNISTVSYGVTLTRGDGGDETIWVKLVLRNSGNGTVSSVLAPTESWDALETDTITIPASIVGADVVEITPLLLDEETGKEQLCDTTDFEFMPDFS